MLEKKSSQVAYISKCAGNVKFTKKKLEMRFVERGICPRLVRNERIVSSLQYGTIMAWCIAHARNGHISTSGKKSDVTIVFLDPDFLYDAKIRRFAYI